MSSRLPPIASAVLLAAASVALDGADDFGLQVHGFASQGFLLTENNNYLGQTTGSGSLDVNEFALNITASPLDRLRLGVQVFARAIGDYGGDVPQIDWAYADYRFNDQLGVTVGRFKIPHGLYNETRDLDMTRSEVFLPMTVYSERLRDVYLAINGAELYASLPSASFGSLDAVAYIGGQNYAGGDSGSVALEFENSGYFNSVSSVSVQRIVGGALTWNAPFEGLRARVSLFDAHHLEVIGADNGVLVSPGAGPLGSDVYGNTAIDAIMQDLWSGILSLEYQYHDLLVAAEYTREYARVTGQNSTSLYANVPLGGGASGTADLGTATSTNIVYRRLEGGYLSAAYRITPKSEIALVRGLGFADYQHRGLSFTRQWTLAARYDILENWLVKAEWEFVQGTQEVFALENPSGMSRNWQVFALKTTVDF
jgi:hypothetical protein